MSQPLAAKQQFSVEIAAKLARYTSAKRLTPNLQKMVADESSSSHELTAAKDLQSSSPSGAPTQREPLRRAYHLPANESKLRALFPNGGVLPQKVVVPSAVWTSAASSVDSVAVVNGKRQAAMEAFKDHTATSLAMISIVFALVENECLYRAEEYGEYMQFLKIPITVCSFLLSGLVVTSYWRTLGSLRRRNDNISSTEIFHFTASLLAELFVCGVHSPPWSEGTISFQFADRSAEYSLDSLALIPITLRLYLLLRSFRRAFAFQGTRLRYAAMIADVDIDSTAFTLKLALERYPFRILSLLFLLTLAWTAYIVRVGELPLDSDSVFEWYSNCLWMIIVTVSTVGYGDIFPETHLGRVTALVAMVAGLVLSSLLISVFSSAVTLSPSEMQFVEQAQNLTKHAQLQIDAILMLQSLYRLKIARRVSPTSPFCLLNLPRRPQQLPLIPEWELFSMIAKVENAMRNFRTRRRDNRRKYKNSRSFAQLTVASIEREIDEFRILIEKRHQNLESDIAEIMTKLAKLTALKLQQSDLLRQNLKLRSEAIGN